MVTLFMVLRQRRSKHFPFNRAKSQNYIVSLHPERVVKSHGHSYCPCIRAPAVLLLETKLTRFCLELSNLENSNSKQDGVRRFTYIRGLVVSWSSHAAFQSLDIEIVGYAGPRSLYPYHFSKRQPEYIPSMFVERQR